MWIFLNRGFFSLVKPAEKDPLAKRVGLDKLGDYLLVRARRKGDIERVFPGFPVMVDKKRDYHYRALVGRAAIEIVLGNEVRRLSYDNFKNSIKDDDYHDACSGVWTEMYVYQRKHGSVTPRAAKQRRAKKRKGKSKIADYGYEDWLAEREPYNYEHGLHCER